MGKKLNKGFHTTGEKKLRYVNEDGSEVEVTKDNIDEFDVVDKLKFFINQYPSLFGGVFDLMGKQVLKEVESLKNTTSHLDLDVSNEEAVALLNKLNPIVDADVVLEDGELEEVVSSEDEGEAIEEVEEVEETEAETIVEETEDEEIVPRKFSSPLAVQSVDDLSDIEKLSYTLELIVDELKSEKEGLEVEKTELKNSLAETEDKLAETAIKLDEAEDKIKEVEEKLVGAEERALTAETESKKGKKKTRIITAVLASTTALLLVISAGLGVSLVKKVKNIESQNEYIDELEKSLDEAEKNVANFFGVGDLDQTQMNGLLIEKYNEITKLASAFGWQSQIVNESGEMVKNPVSAYSFLIEESEKIEDFATKLGYDSENGETISEFIERVSDTNSEEILRQIEDFKNNLRENGFEVEEGKTLTELLRQVYDKNASDLSNEVKNAYVGFATLLSDLGVSVEDVLDENGNLDVSGFNGKVAEVVALAKDNLEAVQNLETKFNAVFESLGRSERVGDFESLEEAFEEIKDSYDEILNSVSGSFSDFLGKAFLEAKIPNGTSFYAPSDFASLEEAGDFLIEHYKQKETPETNVAELEAKIAELESQISALKDEKAGLESQISNLETELETQKSKYAELERKYNEVLSENVAGSENQGSSNVDEAETETTPVADESKDDESNDNGNGGDKSNESNDGREDVR